MSMSEEQLRKTGILKIMLDKVDKDDDDEMTMNEKIEMFEDRLEYIDIDKEKKEKLIELSEKIKQEEDEKVQNFLFKELLKLIEEN